MSLYRTLKFGKLSLAFDKTCSIINKFSSGASEPQLQSQF